MLVKPYFGNLIARIRFESLRRLYEEEDKLYLFAVRAYGMGAITYEEYCSFRSSYVASIKAHDNAALKLGRQTLMVITDRST